MPLPNPALPPAPVRRQVSGISLVSEHTLRKYFLGDSVYPVSRLRIEQALKQLQLERFIRPQQGEE